MDNNYYSSDSYFDSSQKQYLPPSTNYTPLFTPTNNFLSTEGPIHSNYLRQNADRSATKISKSGEPFSFGQSATHKPSANQLFFTGSEKPKTLTPTANSGSDLMKRSFCPGPTLGAPDGLTRNRRISFDETHTKHGMYSSQMIGPSSGSSKMTGLLETMGRTVTPSNEFETSLGLAPMPHLSHSVEAPLSFDFNHRITPPGEYRQSKPVLGLQFSKPKGSSDYNDLRSTGYSSTDNIELCVTPPEPELVYSSHSELSNYKKPVFSFKPAHQPTRKSPEPTQEQAPTPIVPVTLSSPKAALNTPSLLFTNPDGTRPSNNNRFKKKIVFSKDNPENKGAGQATMVQEQQFKSEPLISGAELELPKLTSKVSGKPPCKQDFYFGKKLGKGGFGTVFAAKHLFTGMVFAIKVIDKQTLKDQKIQNQFLRELKIQLFLNHPNICKLYGYFDDSENVYLIMELCYDGMLYTLIKQRRRLPEPEAKQLIRTFCNGTEYLHRHRIIHRDIKLENIIMHEGIAKLCDFGWAVYSTDEYRTTVCGTPVYKTPQQIMGEKYDEKCDIWAIGILSYEILIGKLPFKINTMNDLQKICNDEITFPEYVELSDNAKQFLLNILKKNPDERLDMDEIINHPFLKFEKDEHKFDIPQFI